MTIPAAVLSENKHAYFVIHALGGHALVVGQGTDLTALGGFHPAAAERHFLEAIRLQHVRTVGQP
jgi:hypothetical protein